MASVGFFELENNHYFCNSIRAVSITSPLKQWFSAFLTSTICENSKTSYWVI